MIKYFAYGSNMDLERITERIQRCPAREPATLRGYELRFNKQAWKKPGRAYANIVESENEMTPGILYDVTEEDLAEIDSHESVESGHYRRHSVLVKTADEEMVQAVAHIACGKHIREGLLPTREYLDHLLAGAELLPDAHVQRLREQKAWDGKEGDDK